MGSYGLIRITMMSHFQWLFPLWCLTAPPSPPAERWDNKDSQSNPFISCTTISTGCSATVCGGSPAKRARGGKPLHKQSEAGLFSDARRAVVWFSQPTGSLPRFYTNWRHLFKVPATTLIATGPSRNTGKHAPIPFPAAPAASPILPGDFSTPPSHR